MMDMFFNTMVFILGLCVGSFVNMLIYRTAVRYELINLKFKNLRNNRSWCDYCGRQLKWSENIPVVSWLMLGGRTKCCDNPLPWEYPIIEITMGLLFLIFNLQFSIYNQFQILNLIISLVMVTLLVFSAVFDAKYMILPDFSTYILIALALIGVIFDEKNIVSYLLSVAGAAGFLGLLHIVTKGKGMGIGDVKYAVFMGLLLGWPKIIMAFYIAFISGAVVGGILMMTKKLKKKSLISFGPFLIGGTILAYWYGERLIKFIMSNF